MSRCPYLSVLVVFDGLLVIVLIIMRFSNNPSAISSNRILFRLWLFHLVVPLRLVAVFWVVTSLELKDHESERIAVGKRDTTAVLSLDRWRN